MWLTRLIADTDTDDVLFHHGLYELGVVQGLDKVARNLSAPSLELWLESVDRAHVGSDVSSTCPCRLTCKSLKITCCMF